MFYFALILFGLVAWLLPWWSTAVLALILGVAGPKHPWQVTFAAAVAWLFVAFILDGRSHGLIARRMAGLFSLPSPSCMYLLMAVLGGITAALAYRTGGALRNATSARKSVPS